MATLQRLTTLSGERYPMADNGQKVRDIIEKELGVEREKLTDEASFIEDLGADSLDIVELVMEFEKEFNIDIPDEDAEKPGTVRNTTEKALGVEREKLTDEASFIEDLDEAGLVGELLALN